MKFTTVILSALTAQLVHCNCGDNCGRAILGTATNLPIPLSSRLADCASFMEITVVPAALTSTVTVTSSVTVVGLVGKRDKALIARQMTVSPSAFPAWAVNGCTSAARFIAGCSSCAGISYTTTTAPTPIVTTSVTVFQTVDVPPRQTTSTTSSTSTTSTTSTISTTTSTTPSTQSTTASTTSTTSTTLTTTSTTATPTPSNPGSLCNNPAICAAASVNGCSSGAGTTTSCSGSCYPDSTGQGRCRSDEFAVVCGSQPTCTTNHDCPGGFCITDCCGFPSCYTMAEDAFCENVSSPAKMFRKREPKKYGVEAS